MVTVGFTVFYCTLITQAFKGNLFKLVVDFST